MSSSLFGIILLLSLLLVQNEFFLEINGQGISETTQSNHLENNTLGLYLDSGDFPFYTENTKSTNTRVLNISPVPTVEVTYNGNSSINGSPTQTIGTIIDIMGEDGIVHSEGKAIILTETGQVITYRSESIGHYNPDGSFSDSGVIFFRLPYHEIKYNSNDAQNSTSGPVSAAFDNVFGIYKKTVDPIGNGVTKVWKWS